MNKLKEIDHSKHPIYTRAVDDTRHKIFQLLEKLEYKNPKKIQELAFNAGLDSVYIALLNED